MESRTKVLGHPAHAVLVMFPAALLFISNVFDLLRLVSKDGKWGTIAFYNMLAGCLSGWFAILPGAIDWWFIPNGTRAKRIGTIHAVTNDVGIGLFFVSWLLRRRDPENPSTNALVLSVLGSAFIGLGGWLGGELVGRLGVGVSTNAHLNAPSSLTHSVVPAKKTE